MPNKILNFVASTIITLTSILTFTSPTIAQGPTEVECGTSIDAEFTQSKDVQEYVINLPAKSVLSVDGSAVGDTLTFWMRARDPFDQIVANRYPSASKNPNMKTGVLSATGTYIVQVSNYGYGAKGGGLYSLKFDCTGISLVNSPTSTPQAKSSKPEAQATAASSSSSTLQTPTSGIPALPAIDFANIELAAITNNDPIKDAIDSNATTPTLYTFDAKAKQTLDLSFKRVSGNVNMGIAVIGPDNKVLFQVSLIASDAFNTIIVLPTDGKYTLGVYRVELNPPVKPKATSYELTATVN